MNDQSKVRNRVSDAAIWWKRDAFSGVAMSQCIERECEKVRDGDALLNGGEAKIRGARFEGTWMDSTSDRDFYPSSQLKTVDVLITVHVRSHVYLLPRHPLFLSRLVFRFSLGTASSARSQPNNPDEYRLRNHDAMYGLRQPGV